MAGQKNIKMSWHRPLGSVLSCIMGGLLCPTAMSHVRTLFTQVMAGLLAVSSKPHVHSSIPDYHASLHCCNGQALQFDDAATRGPGRSPSGAPEVHAVAPAIEYASKLKQQTLSLGRRYFLAAPSTRAIGFVVPLPALCWFRARNSTCSCFCDWMRTRVQKQAQSRISCTRWLLLSLIHI